MTMSTYSRVGQRLARPRRWLGHETVADVAHRPDEHLVLQAQLGPQSSHVDVHRAGPAEVVIAPDLLEQLSPGEDPAGVLREVFDQLELLVGQVEQPAADSCRVAGLVNNQGTCGDLTS